MVKNNYCDESNKNIFVIIETITSIYQKTNSTRLYFPV